MVQLPVTAKPPHRLSLELGVIVFTRIASHIYDLSLLIPGGNSHFLGRIEQKSDSLWAVTYIDCQSCMPEYFDDWQQATLFLSRQLSNPLGPIPIQNSELSCEWEDPQLR